MGRTPNWSTYNWREDRGTPHKPSCALVPSVEVWHVATPEVSSRFDDRPTTARSSLVVPCRTFPYNSLPLEWRTSERRERREPLCSKKGLFFDVRPRAQANNTMSPSCVRNEKSCRSRRSGGRDGPGLARRVGLTGPVVAGSGLGGCASRGIRGDASISPVRLGGWGRGLGLALPCAGTAKTKTSSTRLCARRSRHGERYVVDARRSRGWVFRVVRGWGEPRVHHTTVFDRGTGRGCARARECNVRVFVRQLGLSSFNSSIIRFRTGGLHDRSDRPAHDQEHRRHVASRGCVPCERAGGVRRAIETSRG